MPLVTIIYNPGKIHPRKHRVRFHDIPFIVAKELSCDEADGQLVAKDVEYTLKPQCKYEQHQGYDLEFVVDADYYNSRMTNLNERRKKIFEELKGLVWQMANSERISIRYWVWVRLFPSSWQDGMAEYTDPNIH
ncbi:MAG: hypothetical protein Athens101428_24 [Candidatus Berkelbacteria bacterium Athens1014_28]|uniref:Uncharacterized protein n=1 Tax=Candidatus Berkelbacteria bacterium Athens1014_28 TaxID=2017145 RepID=A0A554LR08_9BACT|nr:MAG: hypothetical protein Athens101428_24 [Candidatus Berkelbacteria bacterium Athens1014_28]